MTDTTTTGDSPGFYYSAVIRATSNVTSLSFSPFHIVMHFNVGHNKTSEGGKKKKPHLARCWFTFDGHNL
jgi:hypothetical protein